MKEKKSGKKRKMRGEKNEYRFSARKRAKLRGRGTKAGHSTDEHDI